MWYKRLTEPPYVVEAALGKTVTWHVDTHLTLDDLPAKAVGEFPRNTLDRAYVSYMAWDGDDLAARKKKAREGMRFLWSVAPAADVDLLFRLESGETQVEIAEGWGVSQPSVHARVVRARRLLRGLVVFKALDPLVWDPDLRGWEDLYDRTLAGVLAFYWKRAGGRASREVAETRAAVHAATVVLWFYTGGAESAIVSSRGYGTRWGIKLQNSQSSVDSIVKKIVPRQRGDGGRIDEALGPDWVRALRAIRGLGTWPSYGDDGLPAWRGPSQNEVLEYLAEKHRALGINVPITDEGRVARERKPR